ncbi:hypothetical protein OG943_10725 [Amycolatopsis sp. NBC_00345]|uniref:hypothetical protein n=1 Tax=Amycolatopsis sp. NBC_00345 TaxID=2975955 RepID=UPI002E27031F
MRGPACQIRDTGGGVGELDRESGGVPGRLRLLGGLTPRPLGLLSLLGLLGQRPHREQLLVPGDGERMPEVQELPLLLRRPVQRDLDRLIDRRALRRRVEQPGDVHVHLILFVGGDSCLRGYIRYVN